MAKTKQKISLPLTEVRARLATHKVISADAYKELNSQLAEGDYPIDVVVAIRGGLKKGSPYSQRIVAAANPWALLAKALSKLNQATIESLVRESLEVPEEEQAAVKEAAQRAIEALVAATERECTGKLTGSLLWELV